MKHKLRTPSPVALAIAIGIHGLLLFLLFYATKYIRVPSPASYRSSIAIFLKRTESERKEPAVAVDHLNYPPTLATIPRESLSQTERPSPDSKGVPTTTAPRVDWQLEAESVARQKAPELFEELRKRCEHPEPIPPPECRPRGHEFEWNPEPRNVGIAGGLPYVRLGERCIVGLGFFGCAIGDFPKPNSELFENMRDPDRPRSSVPDP